MYKSKTPEYRHAEYLKVKDSQEYREMKRAWYLKNREEILRVKKEKNDARLALNPRILKTEAEKKAKRDVWNLANHDKRNSDARKWRNGHLSKQQEYAREYYAQKLSQQSQYTRLLRDSAHRYITVQISFEDFIKLVNLPCKYCGETEKRRGLDRVNNEKGYSKENLASCCKICNYMKRNYTKTDFLNHVKKIYKHNFR